MSPPMRWTVLNVMGVILLGVDVGRYNWRYTRRAVDSVEKAVTWTINAGRLARYYFGLVDGMTIIAQRRLDEASTMLDSNVGRDPDIPVGDSV